MNPKVIHNEEDYEKALVRIESLMEAKPGTPAWDDLDLWSTLVSVYEDQHYVIGLPDPVEAVKFRMEQQGLRQGDMIPYFGSASKVSEVLSRKRPLSLSMIRRLHQGLGIPAEVLLNEPGGTLPQESDINWEAFPLAELINRGWIAFEGTHQEARKQAKALIQTFIEPFDPELMLPALLRQHVRKGKEMDRYALFSWRIRVMHLAQEQCVCDYQPGFVCQDFIRKTIQLSIFKEGPRLAREFLSQYGIHLVTLDHLPKTYLDGAAMLMPSGRPLLALTLRHDRLDNFWFTLAHELAHVALHLESQEDQVFFDDLDATSTTPVEKEADHLASESLIPGALWQAACLSEDPSPAKIKAFARRLNIGPSIPAGRIRHETGNYKLLSRLVGLRQVRSNLAVKEKPVR